MLAVKWSIVLERRRRLTLCCFPTKLEVAREVTAPHSELVPSEEVGVKTVDKRLCPSSLAEEVEGSAVDRDVAWEPVE